MTPMPGGPLQARPLHFFWICDSSGSMSLDGKMQSLNFAVREALPHMGQVSNENPFASIMLRTMRFSHGAAWLHDALPLPQFRWTDLEPDPLQRAAADVIFLLDTSGSMSDEIEAVKKSCVSFANTIIAQQANVRLGLIGFDIGGHRGKQASGYEVRQLSTYTLGLWPLSDPQQFERNVQALSLGLFGGAGCYLANHNTTDIFPHVVGAFSGPPEHTRILVIISDEMGDNAGLAAIVSALKAAQVTTHVMGVPRKGGAHEEIARQTGGQFWNITGTRGVQDFSGLLNSVATTIAREMTKKLGDGKVSSGTDMGAALKLMAREMTMPPMVERALPPVLVLISDGQPTDNFDEGLAELMDTPWGRKAVRIAIAIGRDAEHGPLQRFIGNPELKPLQANSPDALVKRIKWASTVALKAASSPAVAHGKARGGNVPIPEPPSDSSVSTGDVW